MTRYLSILLLTLAVSTPAMAIQEYNRPQILLSGISIAQGSTGIQYQMPINDSGALAIGYFKGNPEALNYTDATAFSLAYKRYMLPGQASFYKVGLSHVTETGSGSVAYAPILSFGMDLTAPSNPLAVSFELGMGANTGTNLYELNFGMRF